jgi:alpha-D-xyloside xylohydrolase
MALVPYLYSAFADYYNIGVPPFRALVMDYPSDANTWNCDDQYMIGQSIMAVPIFGNETKRSVYLPKGKWYFFSGVYEGGQRYDIEIPADGFPFFIKSGSILPLARPVEYIANDTVFDITVEICGEPKNDFVLYEDDGVSFDFEKGVQNKLILNWSKEKGGSVKSVGDYKGKRYRITDWHVVKEK